ncbi:hypothetical protein J4456_05000 [Candidatus Pacearchaeota archaeon]|nr:hypothetical protein [Candidatus Pacearchaeota archaeon]
MKIFEPQQWEMGEVKLQTAKLKEFLPDIYFLDTINYFYTPGNISGYRIKCFSECYRVVDIFTEFNLAIVSNEISQQSLEQLSNAGYYIPSRKMNYDRGSGNVLTSEVILWEELKNGMGIELIKKNLESLLKPILQSFDTVQEYRFAIYNPCIVESTDNVFLPYIEYDEIFSLPVTEHNIHIPSLIEKIKKMPSKNALAISSLVLTREGKKHLPMIDFMSTNLEYWEIENVIERLKIPKRILVNSGNSYHHYNTEKLMTEEEFYNYTNIIAEQPEIGKNWPWLSAQQGFTLLRISPSATKPFFPTIEEMQHAPQYFQ